MTPDAFPATNPFPLLGTFTIAGERQIAENVGRWIPRVPIKRLIEEVESYRVDFAPAWTGRGRALILRGPHGSGKTHTIYAGLCSAAAPLKNEAPGLIFSLYTICQDDNFVVFYRQVVARLNKEPGILKKLAQSLLGAMTAEQWSEDLGKDSPDREVAEALRADPDQVARTLDSYTVSRSGTVSRQEKAILDLTPSAFNKDLNAAITALQGNRYDQAAARWLSLEPISSEEQEAIGISGPIEGPDNALAAALLIVALLTSAGYKLILVLDQFEKLLVSTEPIVKKRNEGYIRSLIEGVRLRNALLVLSGSDDGWACLPEDVKSRIGPRVVDCPFLAFEEALDMLRLYLTPAEAEFVPGRGGIYPLTLPAVKEMLTLSGGNPRKFLQFCHEAMRQAIASKTVIDEVAFREIAESSSGQYFDHDSVVAHLRRVLRSQPLRVVEEFPFEGTRIDFAVLYEDASPALLVEVAQAIFQDDEARNAHEVVSILSRARESGVFAPLVLIVTGYISPQVVDSLKSVVQKLICYAPGSFEQELLPVLDAIHRNAPPAQAPANRNLENKVADLLQRLTEQRNNQSVIIQNRVAELVDAQAKYQQSFEAARRDWADLRRNLSEEIRATRESRGNEAQQQVNSQIKLARIFWVVRDGLLTTVAIWALLSRRGYLPMILPSDLDLLLIVSVALAFVASDTLLAAIVPSAWSEVHDPQDLQRFGRDFISATYGMIHAPNPIFRLVRYRSFRSRIPNERLRLIRQAACRDCTHWELPADRSFWTIPEALMLVEADVAIKGKPPADISRAVDILTSLRASKTDERIEIQSSDSVPTEDATSIEAAPLELPSVTDLAAQVGRRKGVGYRLFDNGLDSVIPHQLAPVGERSLREAVRALSPFGRDGLGTYDFLTSIDIIDDMFLFYSQALFYSERGLFKKPESASQLAGKQA
jgi:hypothetical protein